MLDATAIVNTVAHILFVGGLVSLLCAAGTAMVLEQMGRWEA